MHGYVDISCQRVAASSWHRPSALTCLNNHWDQILAAKCCFALRTLSTRMSRSTPQLLWIGAGEQTSVHHRAVRHRADSRGCSFSSWEKQAACKLNLPPSLPPKRLLQKTACHRGKGHQIKALLPRSGPSCYSTIFSKIWRHACIDILCILYYDMEFIQPTNDLIVACAAPAASDTQNA